MTVSGNGAMADYNTSNPWKSYNSSITSIVIEDGVTHVGNGTFPQCTSLVSVVIGDDVETIGEFTFDDAGASLTSVTMGNKVKSIGMAAFLWDTGLPELILSEDLETIGAYAFCRMEALTTITIPSKVTSIGDAAFSNCSALQSIYIEAATPPTLGDDVFANVNADLSTIPLYVPSGSVAAYTAAAQWNAFNIQGYDPAPTPANPTVQINGSWNWSDPWLTFTDNGDGTASVTKELTASSTPYEFGLHINSAWATNGYAFHCGYTSVDNFAHDPMAGNMTLRADMSGVYTFTYTYATNTFSITFPKTTMKGSWDSWADAVEFTPNSNGESAWVTKNFTTEGYYTFKINVGDDDWRGTDVTLKRTNMSAANITTDGDNITLYVDEPGDYSFQWTFASNTLELTWVPDATNKALTTKEDPKNPGVWYSTFYHSMNRYQLPAGVEAYVATVSGETMNLTKIAEAGQVLPENTAVILKADAENISLIPTDATPVAYSATNNLHGVDVVTEIAAAVSGTCYVLSGNSTDGVGFFKYLAPNQLKAHKAYIDLNGSGMAQAPKHLRFVYDQATGIENTNAAVECQKLIENGQLIIIKNGVKYNAQGQIVK